MSIGQRLRALRKHIKLTQDQLGEICGVTKASVSLWEADAAQIGLDRLLAIHARHPFSFDWLLIGVGTPPGDAASPLLAIYSSLDDRGKSAVLRVAEAEAAYLVEPEDKASPSWKPKRHS